MTKSRFFKCMKALFFVLCLSMCAQSLFAQNSNQNSTDTQPLFQTEEAVPENQVPYWSASPEYNNTSSPSTFGLFVKMVFSLLIVAVLIYFVIRFLKKSAGISDSDDDTLLRKVSHISIGAGKSVQIVTLLDKAYLIGVADNSINLLSEINDKELVDSLNILADKKQNTNKPKSFADVLDIFLAGNNAKNKNAFGRTSSFTDALKKQRERFNKGE